jgi:hypothetical protein
VNSVFSGKKNGNEGIPILIISQKVKKIVFASGAKQSHHFQPVETIFLLFASSHEGWRDFFEKIVHRPLIIIKKEEENCLALRSLQRITGPFPS